MKWNKMSLILALCMTGACFAVQVNAADAKTIKQNMKERQSTLDAMKTKGLIGEDNLGYLSVLKTVSAAEKTVINAENSDRKSVYTAIGKQQGAAADLVGKRRAKKIGQSAASGTMVQDEAGKWSKK